MSRDFDRIRAGSNGSSLPPMRSDRQGSMAFLGRVISTGANLGVGIFVRVQRLTILGSPAEGGSPESSDTPDGGTLVLFLGENVPAEDDEVICWREKNRWVARKRYAYSYTPPPPETIDTPGCGCPTVPVAITATLTHPGTGSGMTTFAASYANAPDYSTVTPPDLYSGPGGAGVIDSGPLPGWWSDWIPSPDGSFNVFYTIRCGVAALAQGYFLSMYRIRSEFHGGDIPTYDWLNEPLWFWSYNSSQGPTVPAHCVPFLLSMGAQSPTGFIASGLTGATAS